jgi:hypothetical protein
MNKRKDWKDEFSFVGTVGYSLQMTACQTGFPDKGKAGHTIPVKQICFLHAKKRFK